jgi:hypothetical protein
MMKNDCEQDAGDEETGDKWKEIQLEAPLRYVEMK